MFQSAARTAALAFGFAAVWLSFARAAALLPPPPAPIASQAPATPAPPTGAVLPPGSPLEFVLDDSVDSKKTQPGTTVRLHLRKALIVNGETLAPAGAPATLKVISTRHAVAPDVDGSVQIELAPLQLVGQHALPVRALHDYITIELTAGQQSTNSLEDTAKDIFIPGHAIYKNFRKGRELTLPVGSVLRAETDAAIDASNPRAIVIATPAPFALSTDRPYSSFTPIPLYTVAPPTPRPKPSAKPTPTPAPTPVPAPSPPGPGLTPIPVPTAT